MGAGVGGVGEEGVVRVGVLWRLVVAAEHRLWDGLHDRRARVGGARELQAGAVGLVGLSRCGAVSWRTGPGARASLRREEVECIPVPSRCCTNVGVTGARAVAGGGRRLCRSR